MNDRIAAALERIADALERIPTVTVGELDAKPCDDRACTVRSHWAPPKFNPGGYVGGDYVIPKLPIRGGERVVTRKEIRAELRGKRVNHGSTPTACVHGQDHPDSLTCEYRCAATMPGHWCTRREHADDRHVWAMSDEEAQRHLRLEDWFADPLDEDDHRPRHDRDGDHWVRVTDLMGDAEACWWATGGPDGSSVNGIGELDAIFGPLTFCDCDDADTIEAENGATD